MMCAQVGSEALELLRLGLCGGGVTAAMERRQWCARWHWKLCGTVVAPSGFVSCGAVPSDAEAARTVCNYCDSSAHACIMTSVSALMPGGSHRVCNTSLAQSRPRKSDTNRSIPACNTMGSERVLGWLGFAERDGCSCGAESHQ
eukprot:4337790-Prymnesium_polylepis.1